MLPHLVESPAFSARADALLGDSGRFELAKLLAANPRTGSVIPFGVRRMRDRANTQSERGGVNASGRL